MDVALAAAMRDIDKPLREQRPQGRESDALAPLDAAKLIQGACSGDYYAPSPARPSRHSTASDARAAAVNIARLSDLSSRIQWAMYCA